MSGPPSVSEVRSRNQEFADFILDLHELSASGEKREWRQCTDVKSSEQAVSEFRQPKKSVSSREDSRKYLFL